MKIGGAVLRAALACIVMLGAVAAGPAERSYAVGQVWEYRTRPDDEGSLLRIQQIDDPAPVEGARRIYHISVIGVTLPGAPPRKGQLMHLPVSGETLDASVTRTVQTSTVFPDIAEGIAEWKSANGGVFTVSVAEIVDLAERAMREHLPPSG